MAFTYKSPPCEWTVEKLITELQKHSKDAIVKMFSGNHFAYTDFRLCISSEQPQLIEIVQY